MIVMHVLARILLLKISNKFINITWKLWIASGKVRNLANPVVTKMFSLDASSFSLLASGYIGNVTYFFTQHISRDKLINCRTIWELINAYVSSYNRHYKRQKANFIFLAVNSFLSKSFFHIDSFCFYFFNSKL